jgi:predicted small secreted protein
MRRFSLLPFALLAAAFLLVACEADGSGGSVVSAGSTPSRSAPPSHADPTTPATPPSPTRPALPDRPPPRRGAATATCVNGWVTPAADTPDFTDPLGIIRRTTGEEASFRVVDMRMFVGPESPPSVGDGAKGYLQDIRRWYIKLFTPDDLSFQGRFLVEQRVFGRGLAAVAPFDTRGFRSPDWHGFQFESAGAEPRVVPGLPGTWAGEDYDFVDGGAGLDIPGLPQDVAGCLEGT